MIELTDGRVMMYIRTDQGCVYRSYSGDGGDTWSHAVATDLLSPVSPAGMKRIPRTGDMLLVFNDHRGIADELRGRRTPLVALISTDEGQAWGHRRGIEDDATGW